MPAFVNCVIVLSSILCYVLQSRALNLPNFAHTPRVSRTLNLDFVSNACTTNITIPTMPDECIPSCRLFQGTQLRCQDYSNCMCLSAPSFYLQSCMTCILDGIGDFHHSDFIEETKKVIARYATFCDSLHQGLTSTDPGDARGDDSTCILAKVASSMNAVSPPTRLTQTSHRLLFIFLTFTSSVLLLIIACVYPRMWKQFGLI